MNEKLKAKLQVIRKHTELSWENEVEDLICELFEKVTLLEKENKTLARNVGEIELRGKRFGGNY